MIAKLLHTFLLVMLMTALPISAFAASGSTPNGRPFVEINGQIAEVKSDISALEVKYEEIKSRVNALEGDFQAQIDAMNAEISSLKTTDALLTQQIADLAFAAQQNGYNIQFALSEINRLQAAIDALQEMGGDQAAAIAELESQLAVVKTDVAANASGLLSVIADAQVNRNLITMLQGDVSSLQAALASKQQDIGSACQTGYYAYGVTDSGALLCRQDQTAAGVGSLSMTWVYSYVDLDNWQTERCVYEILGVCIIWEVTTHFGDSGLYVACPDGYIVAGGGYDTSWQDDIGVETSAPSGNGWYAFFDNRASGATSDHWGQVYANCMKIQ